MNQAKKIREFLEWLDTCPFKHRISSMQGDTVCFVRFWLEETGELAEEERKAVDQAFLRGVMESKVLEK
tara:strand:- start:131 stop:337 length:207 start_codon:yes stop_codon:yes gene_type:complete